MIGKVESNTQKIITGAVASLVIGLGVIALGIYVYLAKAIATAEFGFVISAIGLVLVANGIYFFLKRHAYSIELFSTYFIIKNGTKETKIEKADIEDFKIVETEQSTARVRYSVYALEIKYDGVTYYLDPKKYKDLFEKMCNYYGISPEEALKKDSIWEDIKNLINKK